MALALSGISKSFGAFRAIDNADFSVRRGQVHALLGENGAGKSSLMNVAAGLYAPDSGRIELDGKSVQLPSAAAARSHGIGMVHQNFKLVKSFTIAENILLSNPHGRFSSGLAAISETIRALAKKLNFEMDPARRIDTLSIAEQQRVEIVKVLVAGVNYLILDEPTAVLTDEEATRLLSLVRGLAADGVAVVLVTHKLGEVQAFADRVTIMRNGRTIASADPKEFSIAELTSLVIGETLTPPSRAPVKSGGRAISLTGVSCSRDDGLQTVHDLSLQARGGEILGIAGVGGNGQSELSEALAGVRRPTAGSIFWGECLVGDDLSTGPPIAFIPADRYAYGLCGDLSVLENIAIRKLQAGAYGRWFWVHRSAMRADAADLLSEYRVDGVQRLSQKASVLSGGNAQKLVLARELSLAPAIVVAQSPTRGLDARAYSAVHASLLAARERGASVILISEDLDEVLTLSDRVAVMSGGKLVEEFAPPFDRQQIGRKMVHHA